MAKKKHHKKTTRRRHRVGALSMTAGSPLIKYGGIAIGYLMGDTINQQLIDKMVGTPTDPVKTGKTIAVVQLGLGAALAFNLISKKKSMPLELIGAVMAGAGLKRASVVFKAGATTMSGFPNVPVIGRRMGAYQVEGQPAPILNGFPNVPVIGKPMGSYQVPGNPGYGSKIMGSVSADCGCKDNGSSLVG